MPTSEAPTDVNEPKRPAGDTPETAEPDQASPPADGERGEPAPAVRSQSRWVDYDTHELLTMISELEDERRWARLREGVWIAILIHLVLIAAVALLPKYVFKVPLVVDQNDKIKQHQDFTYLDTPRDLQ